MKARLVAAAGIALMTSALTPVMSLALATTTGDVDCPPAAASTQHREDNGKTVVVEVTASLSCPTPKASGHIPPGGRNGAQYSAAASPQDGADCGEIDWWSAIDLSAPGSGPGSNIPGLGTPVVGTGDRVARFQMPPTSLVPGSGSRADLDQVINWLNGVMGGPGTPVLGDAIAVPDHASILSQAEQSIQRVSGVTGLNSAYIRFANRGSKYSVAQRSCINGYWDLLNPASCAGSGAPALTPGSAEYFYASTCMYIEKHPVRPVGNGANMPGRISQFMDASALKSYTHAGTVHSAPNQTSYVNSDSCWWIEGADTTTKAYTFTIDGPVDANGRSISYVYKLTLQPTGVTWQYSSAAANSKPGGFGQGASQCGSTNAYDTVSTLDHTDAVPCPAGYPHPTADDGCYRVSATEHYAGTLDAYWYDSDGSHHRDITDRVPALAAPIDLTPDPVYVRVLQIQGIPITR